MSARSHPPDAKNDSAIPPAAEGAASSRGSLLEAEVQGRQRAEAALLESEERFRSMFLLASVGMVQLDARTGRFAEANPRFCNLTGYTLDELRQMSPVDLDHPDDRSRDAELVARLFRREVPEYFNVKRYVRKDGRIVWVQVNGSLIRDARGEPMRTIAVVHDVTEQKRAAAELRESLERERARAVQLRGLAEASAVLAGNRSIAEILQGLRAQAEAALAGNRSARIRR